MLPPRRARRPASHGHIARLVLGGARFRGHVGLGRVAAETKGAATSLLVLSTPCARTGSLRCAWIRRARRAPARHATARLARVHNRHRGGALFLPPFRRWARRRARESRGREETFMASVTASSNSSLANGIRSRTKTPTASEKRAAQLARPPPSVPSERLVRLDSRVSHAHDCGSSHLVRGFPP